MERALRVLLDWGFAERDLQTVVWLTERGNWASRRLAWKLGFTFDGTVRGWLSHRGALRNAWIGTLLRGEEMTPRGAWLESPTITGQDVVLRTSNDADVPRLIEGAHDPAVRRYSRSMNEGAPYDVAAMRERELGLREEAARGSVVAWTVADPRTDELLGWIALFGVDPGQQAEVGYWTHPAARGRGVAREACRMVARHAFIDVEDGGLGLRRLTGLVAVVNPVSQRVLEQAGFIRIGLQRQSSLLSDGTYADTVLFDLLRHDPPPPPPPPATRRI